MIFLGVVVALPAEASCLTGRRVYPGERIRLAGRVSIQLSGVGAERARSAARSLIESGARALLSWGSAAGLDPVLSAGCLVLPESVIGADQRIYPVDRQWHQRLTDRLRVSVPFETGSLVETPAVLVSPEAKIRLLEHTGAVTADMESAAIAQVARETATPLMVIRAISDPAQMAVPGSALDAVDAGGGLHTWKLLVALMRNPGEIMDLVRIGWGFRVARKALARVARILGPTLMHP